LLATREGPAKKKQQPGSDKSWVNCCCPKIGLPTTSVACNGGEEAGKRKAAEGRGALTEFFLRRLYITGDYGSSESWNMRKMTISGFG